MSVLQLAQLGKNYSSATAALADVSFKLAAGELLAVLGPNGSGKTTLLRLAAGLERPTAGQILLDGRPPAEVAPHQRRVSFLAAGPTLVEHLSARDNLLFGCRLAGGPTAVESARAQQLIGLLDLEPLLDRRPDQLSAGQQQRVALGRALVRPVGLMLLDEPLAQVDRLLRARIRREIAVWLRSSSSTVIWVTHDTDEAWAVGDRVAVLEAGRLEQIDSPEMLFRAPQTIRVANAISPNTLNSLEFSFNPDSILGTDNKFRFSVAGWRLLVDKAPIDGLQHRTTPKLRCGIRPEDLRWATPAESSARHGSLLLGSVVLEADMARVVAVVRQGAMWLCHFVAEDMPVDVRSGVDVESRGVRPLEVVVARDSCQQWLDDYGSSGSAPCGPLQLRCRTEDLHWFDGQTGRRRTVP